MPIYKSWRARSSEAWYQLSEPEQESLLEQVSDALTQVGGKLLVACRSGWSSEKWEYFGVEEFPDIEAVQKHTELLNELSWPRYIDSDTLLGTEYE